MPEIDGVRLRAWRRSRGWDVTEMARRIRAAARDAGVPVAAPSGLIRMIHAWERGDHNLTERYKLLYASALESDSGLLMDDTAITPPAVREAEIMNEPRDLLAGPRQLPGDIGDFSGRTDEIRALSAALTTNTTAISPGVVPIALVVGAGGLGKTAFAVHTAHQIRTQFPDGQLYMDLRGASAQPLAPGDVLARFLRDLGIGADRIPASEADRAALYRTSLGSRRMLIVLDNAGNAAQVGPLLPGMAGCSVLVTTRNRMPELASTTVVDLDVLSDGEANALFTRIVGDERAAAEPDSTAEILEACAGLPLAIRICAARLAARTRWSIATMAGRLRDKQRRLHEMQVGDLAVRTSFEVSYASLRSSADGAGADSAYAFRLLGVWEGQSISVQAAAALLDRPEDPASDLLEGLVDSHLLESPAPERYRFHDLIGAYAMECAQAEESVTTRFEAIHRLLAWYLTMTDGASDLVSPHRYRLFPGKDERAYLSANFKDLESALGWYDDERTNVVAATRLAASAGLHEMAWRLPTALFSVFVRRSNWLDCIATHRIALESVRLDGNRQGEAWVLNNLGEALARMRDEEAIGCLQQAVAMRREVGDDAGEGQAALNLAEAYHYLNGPAAAIEPAMHALRLLRKEGNSYRHGIILINLGECLLEVGRVDEAIGHIEQARAIFIDIGSANGVAHALLNLGRAFLALGRLRDALDHLQRALAAHQSTGDPLGRAWTLKLLGNAYQLLSQTSEARESLTKSLDEFASLGDEAQAAEIRTALDSL